MRESLTLRGKLSPNNKKGAAASERSRKCV